MISRRFTTLALGSLALTAMFTVAIPARAQEVPKVKLATSMGDIVVQLDPAKAPKTVENFLAYVNDKHYNGTVFHRVINGFMVQGGGFTPDMVQKPTKAPIALVPDSATAQFFINVKNNDMLNARQPSGDGYAVFGKVIAGADVVDKIKAVPTGNRGGMGDVPITPVTILSATVVK